VCTEPLPVHEQRIVECRLLVRVASVLHLYQHLRPATSPLPLGRLSERRANEHARVRGRSAAAVCVGDQVAKDPVQPLLAEGDLGT